MYDQNWMFSSLDFGMWINARVAYDIRAQTHTNTPTKHFYVHQMLYQIQLSVCLQLDAFYADRMHFFPSCAIRAAPTRRTHTHSDTHWIELEHNSITLTDLSTNRCKMSSLLIVSFILTFYYFVHSATAKKKINAVIEMQICA